ncbi:MAG: NAD(P)/FAD-dependent oxidoreductase [Bacillota bacterium]
MGSKSIIIIGAGIAGLATGCYAQMNGYRTHVFELHDKPGGLCTAWKRKVYTIDGCIHHLAGSSPNSGLYGVWQELGAVQAGEVLFHEELVRVEGPGGRAFVVYTDIDRLEQHMKELAPADARVIEEYTGAARLFTHLDMFSFVILKPWEIASKMLPRAGAFIKWGKITLERFATRFNDPFLRQAFPVIQYDFPDIPMLVHLNFLACCHNRTLGWPMGGSLAFSRAIEERYRELGGEIDYRARVTKILVENDCAVGVRLADGTQHHSDIVISAADGHSTVFDMLEGRYANERIRAYYAAAPDHCKMSLHVSLGVARDMSREPHALTYFLKRPIIIMNQTVDRLNIEIFNFDPSQAPNGKSVVKALFDSSYAYWKDLSADRARYEDEKRRIAEVVIDRLDERFPGLAKQVEVVDVATPLTFERYTGNWQGLQAWLPPGGGFSLSMKGFSKTLPGLKNFHMVGQWAEAMIGVSTAAVSGRKMIQMLCKRDKKRFVTTRP